MFFDISGKIDNHKLALYKIQSGRNLVRNNKFEEARESFEKAFEIDENLFITYYFIGNSYASESNAIYEKGAKIDKENIDNSLSLE